MSAIAVDQLNAQLRTNLQPASEVSEASLLALALLQPGQATDWLLEQDTSRLDNFSRAFWSRFLSTLAEAFFRGAVTIGREDLVELVRRCGHLLSADLARDICAAARVGDADAPLIRAIESALANAPTNAGLLRSAAELAIAGGDHGRGHDLLTRLGRAEPTLATMKYVYSSRSRLLSSGQSSVRLGVLSSFTIDTLVPFVDLECRALNLEPNIFVAPFNGWEREMLTDGSSLQNFAPEIVFLAVAADDLLPQLAGWTGTDFVAEAIQAVDRLLTAVAHFTSVSTATVVVHGLFSVYRDPFGPAAGRDGPSRTEAIHELNRRLADGLRAMPRAYFLDVADVLTRRREGGIDNPKMRHLASMRLSEHVLGELATAYAGYIAPLKGRTRKCVVLDLDNTLWGGIVGEDGPHGIRLGTTSPGSEFREFQQYLLSLTRRGILLAINSKNNQADALEVIRSHEAMVLREDSFSAMRINWESKASNMLQLADELNIGLDSFVFVDDNEKERALMRYALPQVLTPELPRDPARYRETLETLPELQSLRITDEDRTRARQYVERRQRESLRVSAQTQAEYLASLDIVVQIEAASERTLARVHQLFQRTNQFNLTGKRYDVASLASRATAPDWRIYSIRVQDRFGDHGLVASTVVAMQPELWSIDNLVMSCRVIGYGVEDALLAHVAAEARRAGARWLNGLFVQTAKNAPARDFYERSSFTHDRSSTDGESWRRDLSEGTLPMPAWVTMRGSDDT